MLHWDRDSEDIIERISSVQLPFKVVLKTADDPILLPLWLKHYLSFMPPSGIVIADNMSNDSCVLDTYASMHPDIVLFQYTDQPTNGFHNVIHDRATYAALYEALRRSCSHSIFLDTDEFLYLIVEDGWKNEYSVISQVLSRFAAYAVPTVWLQAVRSSINSAYIGETSDTLASGLAWGKPFVPTAFSGSGFLIHNIQFPFALYPKAIMANLFLLHLADFSPDQRLSANRRKLAARRFARITDSFEAIAEMDPASSNDPTVVRLVNEIRDQLQKRGQVKTYAEVPDGCLRLNSDGSLECSGPKIANNMATFLENAASIFDNVYKNSGNLGDSAKQDKVTMQIVKANAENDKILKSLADALARIERNDIIGAESLLREKMLEWPLYLDAHGDLAFKKELLRLLLRQRRFDEAQALIPASGERGGSGWHHILFARAFDSVGERRRALAHWRAFASTRRDHAEANAAILGGADVKYPEPFNKIIEKFPFFDSHVMFDIGANTGQSCSEYTSLFPLAQIYSFEPAPPAFRILQDKFKNHRNVSTHQLAMSDSSGDISLIVDGASTLNHVGQESCEAGVSVRSTTIFDFCREHKVHRINFLKIDTEGHDLSVLRGCGSFINNVDFIQCEASANRYNGFHCSYNAIFDYLSDVGFFLFHIYGLTYEWANGGYPVLRRFDPVFVNRRLVGEMRNVLDK